MAKKTMPLAARMQNDVSEDQALASAPTNQVLATVAELARRVRSKELVIEELGNKLASLEKELKSLVEKDLPDAMIEAGLKEFTTVEGLQIKVKPEIYANITKENQPKAFAWLRKNKYGDIIKSLVSLAFGSGEDKRRKDVVAQLAKLGYYPELRETIHAGTLKAFVRECREKGVAIPEATFGIYEITVAKVTVKI